MSKSGNGQQVFFSCCCRWCGYSCLACILWTTSFSSTVGALNIGALVNPATQNGVAQMIAIEVAVQQFNTSTSSPLFLDFRNSSPGAAADAVDSLTTGGWKADVVLVGAGTSSEEDLMAATTKHPIETPIITFPNGPNPSPATSWPSLVRMPGRLTSQMRCIVDLVGSYSWRRVIVLFEDDDGLGRIAVESISFFSRSLRSAGSDIERYKIFPRYDSLPDPTRTIEEGLKEVNGSKCRVFVVMHASPSFATELFRQATNLGMMNEGYVWVTNDGMITGRLKSSVMSPYTQGVVEVVSFVNQSHPSYPNFLANFQRRFTSKTGTQLSIGDGKLDVFLLLAHDAVQAIATASKTSKTPSADDIAESNLQGLSGYIRFEDRELSSSSSLFTIVNVVGTGVRMMGNWSEGKGFFRRVDGARGVGTFGAVHWPGGPLWTPGGWDVLDVLVPINGTFPQFIAISGEHNYSGLSLEVFKEALRRMPYHVRIKYHTYKASDRYDDMLELVNSREKFYAAVGDITIAEHRMQYVDFTIPYMDSGLTKMVPLKRMGTSLIFLKPFTWRMWLTIAGASLFTGIVVWFLERSFNPENYRDRSTSNQICSGVWFACSAIFFSQAPSLRFRSYNP